MARAQTSVRQVWYSELRGPQKAAILAAMKITDELFHAREQGDELAAEMNGLAAEIRRLLPPAKRGESV